MLLRKIIDSVSGRHGGGGSLARLACRSPVRSAVGRAGLACCVAMCLCASGPARAASRKLKIDPASLLDRKFKVVLNLTRSKQLRARDVKYSFFPDGRRCAFVYTGPQKTQTISDLSKIGLRTTCYVAPTASADRVKALEKAGAEVGVTGYWGAKGGYASLIEGNSAQEAFDAVATSRLAVRKLVVGRVVPSGSCGGHISPFSFPVDRNMDAQSGYGAVFQDSNFLALGFGSQQCISVFLGLEGAQQVTVRSLNRNTMRSRSVPNELIYYQLLAGQFEGAIRQAREGQIVQFSLRDFKQADLKLLEKNIGEYGKHPAIWHATDGMIASGEYIKKNVHILEIRKSGAKQYEITLGVEKDAFAPYLMVPLSLALPKRFPVESASFEGRPCRVTVVAKTKVPHVTIPLDTYLTAGCTMTLAQSAPDMTIPDAMAVTLTLTNTLDKPISDARLTWIGSSRFSGLTPSKRGRGTRMGVKAGPGLAVSSADDSPFTLPAGGTKKIAATARTVRGARFGIIPVQAVLTGKVDGRERVFLGGFEITVAPIMRVDMVPNIRMPLPKGEHQYFEIRLANGKGRDKFIHHKAGPCRGVLSFRLPEGMTAEPAEHPFDFGANDRKTFLVKVTNGAWGKQEVTVKPIIKLAGSEEALELIEPGTKLVFDLFGTLSVALAGPPNGVNNARSVGRQNFGSRGGFGPLGDNLLTVRGRHGVDHIGVSHQSLGDRLGFMRFQLHGLFPENLQNLGAGSSPHPGGYASRSDHQAVVFYFVGPATNSLGGHLAEDPFGHGAAAGVARTDEQHLPAGQLPNGGPVADPLPDHPPAGGPEADDRAVAAVSRRAAVNHHLDPAVQQVAVAEVLVRDGRKQHQPRRRCAVVLLLERVLDEFFEVTFEFRQPLAAGERFVVAEKR
ncbi:hypothetical protein LCGC14_1678380, partial [marine sediment metagenome]